jgi:hypothetical protein
VRRLQRAVPDVTVGIRVTARGPKVAAGFSIRPEGVFQMLRLVPSAVAVLALLLPASALAQKKVDRETQTSPATFQITSAACPNLPAGTTITGQGTLTSTTWTSKRRGVTTVINTSVASGTATDQAGNASTWVYSNQFFVLNTRKKARKFSGTMIDVFELKGPTPLSNGFLARFRTDFAGHDVLKPIDEFGDPYDFAAGEARCDPL